MNPHQRKDFSLEKPNKDMQQRAVTLLALLAILVVGCTQAPTEDQREVAAQTWSGKRSLSGYSTLEEWEQQRKRWLLELKVKAGLEPGERSTPALVREFDVLEGDGYSVRRVVLTSAEGLAVDGNLYEPDGEGPKPALLLVHGHKPDGRFTDDDLFSQPTFARHLAQMGIRVYSYDQIGYNDSTQFPHTELDPAELLWGINLMGLQLECDLMALDFLTGLEGTDLDRVGCVGWSGGGTQTLLLSAVDERVKVSVPCVVLSLSVQDTCPCGCAPTFRHQRVSPELAALIAPRPMLVVSANDFTWETPKEIMPFLRSVYSLYGYSDRVENRHTKTEWHSFSKESRLEVYRYLSQQFAVPLREEESTAPFLSEKELRSPTIEWVPADQVLKNKLKALEGSQASLDEYRAGIPLEWPTEVSKYAQEDAYHFIGRPGRGDRFRVLLKPGEGQPTVFLSPGGIESSQALVESYPGPALALDPLERGGRPERATFPKDSPLCYNLTTTTEQMQDCLTGLAYLHQLYPDRTLRVVAEGKAALWATAMSPFVEAPAEFEIEEITFPQNTEEMVEQFFVPLFLRLGGFEAAKRLGPIT